MSECQCKVLANQACNYACPCANPLMSGVCARCAMDEALKRQESKPEEEFTQGYGGHPHDD